MTVPASVRPAPSTGSGRPGPDRSGPRRPGRVGIRLPRLGISLLVARRTVGAAVILMALVAVTLVASLALGTLALAPAEVFVALFGSAGGQAELVIGDLRLPRVCAALVCGAAFGLAGAILQSLARNPLASPDMIGLGWGASAAVVFLVTTTATTATLPVALAAVAGTAATALGVYLLSLVRGRLSTNRMVLVGIGVNTALSSLTILLIVQAEVTEVQKLLGWIRGNLNGVTWPQVVTLAVVVAVVGPLALATSRELRISELGDDLARTLGGGRRGARGVLVALAVALAGVATATAGPVQFVALASPQIARRVARRGEPVLVLSALVGALVTAVADLAGRTLASPLELPVGVVTAAVGAPYLLWLLAAGHRRGVPIS